MARDLSSLLADYHTLSAVVPGSLEMRYSVQAALYVLADEISNRLPEMREYWQIKYEDHRDAAVSILRQYDRIIASLAESANRDA